MSKLFDVFATSIVEILTKAGCSKDTVTWMVIIAAVCTGVLIVFIPVYIFDRYINQSSPNQKKLTLPASYSTNSVTARTQMATRDSQESIALGIQLYQVIEEYRRAHGDMWNWETFVSEEDFNCNGKYDPDLVCRTAGCWYRNTEDGRLRFYCNQNHALHGGRPVW